MCNCVYGQFYMTVCVYDSFMVNGLDFGVSNLPLSFSLEVSLSFLHTCSLHRYIVIDVFAPTFV